MAILKTNETIKSTIWEKYPVDSTDFHVKVRDSNELSYIVIRFSGPLNPDED